MSMTAHTVSKASATAAYGGSGAAVYFGMAAHELAAIGGLVVAVLGLVVNVSISIYFKRQHLQLARQRFQKREAGDPE